MARLRAPDQEPGRGNRTTGPTLRGLKSTAVLAIGGDPSPGREPDPDHSKRVWLQLYHHRRGSQGAASLVGGGSTGLGHTPVESVLIMLSVLEGWTRS